MIDEEIAELRKLASETWGHPGVGLTYSQAADLVILRELAQALLNEHTQTLAYLQRLIVSVAPECIPLSDLGGVCTQIDNLLTAVTKMQAEHEAMAKVLVSKFVDNGGPAFPPAVTSHPYGITPGPDGMSLRDWLAGQALAGLVASEGLSDNGRTHSWDARVCYDKADAMLKARKA